MHCLICYSKFDVTHYDTGRHLMRNKGSIFRPQCHTAGHQLCVKMCEYIENVLETQAILNGNTFET